MKVKAKASFCGALNMALGEVRDVPEGEVLTDLLRAGLVEPVGDSAAPAENNVVRAEESAPKKSRRTKKS